MVNEIRRSLLALSISRSSILHMRLLYLARCYDRTIHGKLTRYKLEKDCPTANNEKGKQIMKLVKKISVRAVAVIGRKASSIALPSWQKSTSSTQHLPPNIIYFSSLLLTCSWNLPQALVCSSVLCPNGFYHCRGCQAAFEEFQCKSHK